MRGAGRVMKGAVVVGPTIKVMRAPWMTGVRVGVEVIVGRQGKGSTNISLQLVAMLGMEW